MKKNQNFYWRIVTIDNYRLNIKVFEGEDSVNELCSYSINYHKGESRFEVEKGVIEKSNIDVLIEEFIEEHKENAKGYTNAIRKFTLQFLCKVAFDYANALVKVSQRIEGKPFVIREDEIDKKEINNKINKFLTII